MQTSKTEKKYKNPKSRSTLKIKKAIPYREAVGSLLYISNTTRPDIAFAVNSCARNQHNYTLSDWVKIERIIRYLNGSSEFGLMFTGEGSNLEAYSDASLG